MVWRFHLTVYLILSSLPAFGVVELFERVRTFDRSKCENIFSSQYQYLKSLKGIRRSIGGKDPVDTPVQEISKDGYQNEVESGLQAVKIAFRKAWKKMDWPEDKIETALRIFEEQDRKFLSGDSDLQVAYFISRGKEDAIGVMRAILVKKGESHHLPMEDDIKLPNVNRVELGRAYIAGGKHSDITLREMLAGAAGYFKTYFGDDIYEVYGLTDYKRTLAYAKSGFESKIQPTIEDDHKNYFIHQSGRTLYYRYAGHIEEAYKVAFNGQSLQPEYGLALLRRIEKNEPGMKEYIPNLAAQSTVLAFMGKYQEALDISNRLKEIGSAEVNDDYNVLWQARLAYDPFSTQPEGSEVALNLIDTYLKLKPLDTENYNHRAALFVIYQLKIFLAKEDFSRAAMLLRDNKKLITMTVVKYYEYYDQLHKAIRSGRWIGVLNRSDWETIKLSWDLNTNRDQLAVSVLAPEAYGWAEGLSRRYRTESEAKHYGRIKKWLLKELENLGIPFLGN